MGFMPENLPFQHRRCSSSHNSLRGIQPLHSTHPLRHFALSAYGATSSFDGIISSKFVKVFLNDSCQIALFSLNTSLSGKIHILSKRYSPWEQTCWLLSTDCTKENEFWHPLCKLLLSSQDRAKSLFGTFSIFFALMITFFVYKVTIHANYDCISFNSVF